MARCAWIHLPALGVWSRPGCMIFESSPKRLHVALILGRMVSASSGGKTSLVWANHSIVASCSHREVLNSLMVFGTVSVCIQNSGVEGSISWDKITQGSRKSNLFLSERCHCGFRVGGWALSICAAFLTHLPPLASPFALTSYKAWYGPLIQDGFVHFHTSTSSSMDLPLPQPRRLSIKSQLFENNCLLSA